jgi:hypothetical protein
VSFRRGTRRKLFKPLIPALHPGYQSLVKDFSLRSK